MMTIFRSESRKCLSATLLAALCLGACSSSRLPDKPTPHSRPSVEDGAVVGFRISQPATLYGLTKQALVAKSSHGNKAAGLPQSLPLLVVSVLGLPPLTAGRLAEHGDWVGVVTQPPAGAAAWAFAVPLQSGSELLAELTLGAAAPRRAATRPGWTELEGPNVGVLGPLCVGVASNWLVFGANCPTVTTLTGRLTSLQQTAPTLHGPGLALRLLAQRTVLQGAYAAWSDRLWQSLRPLFETTGVSYPGLGDALTLLNARVSAHWAHLDAGELVLELDGLRLFVNGKFDARSLPTPVPERALCETLAAMPDETGIWMAGIGADVEGLEMPDWDSSPGEWEYTLAQAFASTLGESERNVNQWNTKSGPWALGVRESPGGRTLWALFEGVTPVQLLEVMPQGRQAAAKQVQQQDLTAASAQTEKGTWGTLLRDGRTLFWGMLPWRGGVAAAVGAPFEHEWQRWASVLRSATVPRLRRASCQGAVGAVGVGTFAELVVARTPEGLELQGLLDVNGQWSTTR